MKCKPYSEITVEIRTQLKTVKITSNISAVHCKYLNARFACNDIVIFIYSHYPLDLSAKSSDTKGKTIYGEQSMK